MKIITNILLTHALLLALFAGAAIALAQEPASTESDIEEMITETRTNSPAERQAQMEARQAELENKAAEKQAQAEGKKAEITENIAERQAQMEERKSEVQENIAERRAALQERAQERVTNLAANISNRIDAAIERIQNIIDRIESRIEKLSEMGVDTSAAKTALASAQASLDAAAAKIATIDEDVTAAVSSEDVRANWVPVKASYAEVRNHLKTAHTELQATVTALKKAVTEAQLGNGVSDAVRSNINTETEEEEIIN